MCVREPVIGSIVQTFRSALLGAYTPRARVLSKNQNAPFEYVANQAAVYHQSLRHLERNGLDLVSLDLVDRLVDLIERKASEEKDTIQRKPGRNTLGESAPNLSETSLIKQREETKEHRKQRTHLKVVIGR